MEPSTSPVRETSEISAHTARQILRGEVCLFCLVHLTDENRKTTNWAGEWTPNYNEDCCETCYINTFLAWDEEEHGEYCPMPYFDQACDYADEDDE